MRSSLFFAVLVGLAGSAACAESAVKDDYEEDAGAIGMGGDLDAGLGADDSIRRDAARSDAGRPGAESDASVGDAGTTFRPDAGGLDSGTGAARDAGRADSGTSAPGAVDAGKPPVVDAGPPACSEGRTRCSGQCVDTQASDDNCGACGTMCSDRQSCGNGVCVTEMNVPQNCSAKTFEGHSYLFCTNTRSWRRARQACIDADMDLVIVGSLGESDFVKANGESWIGGSDLNNEQTWRAPVPGNLDNTNGATLGYLRWAPGEPSNTQRCDGLDIFVTCLGARSDEDCATERSDGQWNDADCNNNVRYVCEQR